MKRLSTEQREKLQVSIDFLKRDMWNKYADAEDIETLVIGNVNHIELCIAKLTSSEQLLQKENERLLAFCKSLASEEEMYQEGRYETEMEKLQSASQLQSNVYRNLELRHRAKCDQLKESIEVLKLYAEQGYRSGEWARDFLSSLSQGTEETQ